jgi:hypothetical protein
MNENDLRTALHQHTETVDAARPAAGWNDVEARASHLAGQRRARMAAVGLAAAVVIALLAVGVGALTGDDGPKRVRTADRPDETTSTTESSTTTTPTTDPAAGTSSTVPTPPDPETVGGIYPDYAEYQRSGTARYGNPVDTALAFAKEYVGMKTPLAGKAVNGAKPGTKKVSIRPNSRASLTTVVELSPVGEGGPWTVTGSHTDSITLDDPAANDAIGSPTHLAGSALAFEGHVVVEVRDGGQKAGKALGRTFVTGGGDIKRPFDGYVSFTKASKAHGGLLLWEDSAEDGAPISATVIRVAFGGKPDEQPPAMSNDSRLRIDGIEGVRLGMDLEQARNAFKIPTVFTDSQPCQALAPQGDPAGLSVVLIGNRVSLITISSGPLKTEKGIAVGSTVAQVKAAYPAIDDRGTRLVLRGTGAFAGYSMVFEQANGKVTAMWSGVRDVAEADEACA